MQVDQIKALNTIFPRKLMVGFTVAVAIGVIVYGVRTMIKLNYDIKLADAQIKDLQQQAELRKLEIEERTPAPAARVVQPATTLNRNPLHSSFGND